MPIWNGGATPRSTVGCAFSAVSSDGASIFGQLRELVGDEVDGEPGVQRELVLRRRVVMPIHLGVEPLDRLVGRRRRRFVGRDVHEVLSRRSELVDRTRAECGDGDLALVARLTELGDDLDQHVGGFGDDHPVGVRTLHPGDEGRHIDGRIERDVGLVDQIGRALEHRLDEVRHVPARRVVGRHERDLLGPGMLQRRPGPAARRRSGGDGEHVGVRCSPRC